MSVDIVTKNTEELLISYINHLEYNKLNYGILYFKFSSLDSNLDKIEFVLLLKPVFSARDGRVYFCDDGDAFIVWNGEQSVTAKYLRNIIYENLIKESAKPIDSYYHGGNSIENIRNILKSKALDVNSINICAESTNDSYKKEFILPPGLDIDPDRIDLFKLAVASRSQRKNPEILFVEDQLFFNKLLSSILSSKYKTYSASRASKALEIYLCTAPDIVLLDINLPDVDGHILSATIKSLDPEAFIIMVTGNDDDKSVKRAYENGAKGFITKPYSTQKIVEAIDKFKLAHGLRA